MIDSSWSGTDFMIEMVPKNLQNRSFDLKLSMFLTIKTVWEQLEGHTRAPRDRLTTADSNLATRTFKIQF